ncbi:MAG: flippase-like domain-containing protein [Candidatus Omnitrophica bacterium]|nr:flippase-like domain-containing protein [Candidatus Omnitrophota bacterium]
MKAKISTILRVFISGGLVAILLWSMRSHFPGIANTLSRTNIFIFSLAVLMFIFIVTIVSSRLKLLFVGEGIHIPLGRVIQLSFIGYFFNNFMPTAVGGDIVKAYYASKQTKETAKSFIAVFMDRFIGLFSFICIAAFALFISWKNLNNELKALILISTLCGIASFIIILNQAIAKFILKAFSKLKLWNIGQRLSKVYMAVHEYRNRKALIFAVIGISIICQSFYFSMIYLLARALGTDLRPTTVFLIMPIVSVISMLPSLGGLGIREGAIVALFGPFIGSDNAFSLSILLLATLLITSLVGAVIYISASQFKIKQSEISALDAYRVG